MSYTITLVNTPGLADEPNYAVPLITVADFMPPTPVNDAAPAGGTSSHHQYALSGSDGKGTTLDLSVRTSPEKTDAAGNPQINTRATATLNVLVLAVDSVSGKEYKFPVQAGIFFNYPSNVRELGPAQLEEIVGCVVGIVLAPFHVTLGTPTASVLENMFYGSTSSLS